MAPSLSLTDLIKMAHKGGHGVCTGTVAAVGEENCVDPDGLLGLERRQRGRDILTHEFAHLVMDIGLDHDGRGMIKAQYEASKNLWEPAYASNNHKVSVRV